LLEKQRNFQGPDAPCRPPSPRTSWRGRRHACRRGQDAADSTTGSERRNKKKIPRGALGRFRSGDFAPFSAGNGRRISPLPYNSPFVRQYVMVSTSFVKDGLTSLRRQSVGYLSFHQIPQGAAIYGRRTDKGD
jgi:hypothetical protein